LAHPPVTYLAAAATPDGDVEMLRRIEAHRQRRARHEPAWQAVEEPWDVPRVVRAHGSAGTVLVECVNLWVTNLLLGLPGREALADEEILVEVTSLAGAAQEVHGRVIVVSSEVGCGLMPANALARRFGDVLGEANQRLAAAAAEVYGCLAGIPIRM